MVVIFRTRSLLRLLKRSVVLQWTASCKHANKRNFSATNNNNGIYVRRANNPTSQYEYKFEYRLYYRSSHSSKESRSSYAKLSPQEVDSILRTNEYNHEFSPGSSVKSYDSNQLASNNPMEDTRAEASCLQTTGLLVGVFDGHGGGACAQVLAKRLFRYITACLLPPDKLEECHQAIADNKSPMELYKSYNDKVQFVDDVRDIYRKSFEQFIEELSSADKPHFDMTKALETAVMRLDEDLSSEALARVDGKINLKTMAVAMSGAVACVAHIDGPHLHVANVGDCNAVVGVRTETNSWVAKKLTTEHNTDNRDEVERIISEHPYNESNTVIKMERLLGQLAPLRALGDYRYKWSKEIMRNVVAKHFGDHMIAPNYYTPPYLTSRPDVIYHRLTPRDKFLVLATDGLWDCISPLQVVRLVGEHMSGKRKEGLKTKPKDTNAATHLMRNALGGTEYGIDHGKLSQLLSLPDDVVRVFRDDITITVIYFDSEYLRHCPV
ncbi:pyruvate dehydrogenase [acetyl-transferring]-phosphatase 1, mitochondrial isoform X2 [Atheta coriaria]|uniref:pyruvate dehydrogenase [acetyl-transferring]-phosphatase 1, mitochondrial isoform X2 n=1 Tax=Dalotia coriaria TaxID=877792 RepID=UPI0031F45BF6